MDDDAADPAEISSSTMDRVVWIDPQRLPMVRHEIGFNGLNRRATSSSTERIRESATDDDSVLRLNLESFAQTRIEGDVVAQRFELRSIELRNGELRSVDTTLRVGDRTIEMVGNVIDRELVLKINSDGKKTTKQIPWESNFRGPFAVTQTLLQKPFEESESREFSYFDPVLSEVVRCKLVGESRNKLPNELGESVWCRGVRQYVATQSGIMHEKLLWVDPDGRIQSSIMLDRSDDESKPKNNIRYYRSTESAAQEVIDAFELQEMDRPEVIVGGDVQAGEDAESAIYEVRLEEMDPFLEFPSSGSQRIDSKSPERALITIAAAEFNWADRPDETIELSAEDRQRYLRTQTKQLVLQPTVARQATEIVNSRTDGLADDVAKVQILTEIVGKQLRELGFSPVIRPAVETAAKREATAIDQAIYFTALARALDIPTRVAMGIQIEQVGRLHRAIFYSWNEVYVDGRWVSVELASGRFGPQLNRIKLRDSDMNDENPYGAVLQVISVLEQLTIGWMG
jgi:hypothetical protein